MLSLAGNLNHRLHYFREEYFCSFKFLVRLPAPLRMASFRGVAFKTNILGTKAKIQMFVLFIFPGKKKNRNYGI